MKVLNGLSLIDICVPCGCTLVEGVNMHPSFRRTIQIDV